MSIDVNPDDDFHVVINGNVLALKLDDLDDFYQTEVINEESLIWQQGLGEWMRLDVVLAELEKHNPVAPAPPVADDMYYVLVAPEEVKQMSLDLLDDAYRLEVIDDDTLVWQPGFTEWIPLSLLIGDEPMPHVTVAPSLAPAAYSAPAYASAPYSAPSYGYQSAPSSFGASAPPVALTVPLAPPAASPWFARTLVALSCMAAVFAMVRNGVGAEATEGVSQGKELAGRDTPHGLQNWLDEINAQYELDDLSETEPVPEAAEKVAAPDAAKSGSASTQKTEKAPASKQVAKASALSGAQAEETKPKAPDAAAAFGAKLENKPAPARAAAPARSYRPSSSKRMSNSGDPNDPMNGSL